MCPYADFGEEISFSSKLIIKLKEKGDKLHFRIIDKPYYDGKHFLRNADGTWNVVGCPRINDGGECDYCREYFKIKAKEAKETDTTLKKQLDKQAQKYSVGISFYYPVINREDESLHIFQTTMGMRGKIEAEAELGTKILTVDFIALNTGGVGKDKYALSKLDSAETKDLTVKEISEVERYHTLNLAELVGGRPDDEGGVAEETEETEATIDDVL